MCLVMSSASRDRVERAKSRLKAAFERSKSSFLEEADSILSNTIEQSPQTSSRTRGPAAPAGKCVCTLVLAVPSKNSPGTNSSHTRYVEGMWEDDDGMFFSLGSSHQVPHVAGDFMADSLFSRAGSLAKQRKRNSVPTMRKFVQPKAKPIVVCFVP